HHIYPAAIRCQREAAADDFPQRSQVGLDGRELLNTAEGDSKPGHDFIEDEQCSVPGGELPEGFEKSGHGWNAAHIADYRLDDHGGDLVTVLLECALDGCDRVVGQGDR